MIVLLSIFSLVPALASTETQDSEISQKLFKLIDANSNDEIELAEIDKIRSEVINFHGEDVDLRFDINGDQRVSGADFGLVMSFVKNFKSQKLLISKLD